MKSGVRHHSRLRGGAFVIAILLLVCGAWQSGTEAQQPLYLQNFSKAAEPGFGDFHNSMARAMIWWNNKLYVGTSRDFGCAQAAIIKQYLIFKPYPPPDMTAICDKDPKNLSLQAEIHRWTPGANPGDAGTWERVYQSPLSTQIPNTQKFIAREAGFRDMAVFTEPGGTQALYATTTTAEGWIKNLPPPSLLRSTDGVNWAPVPADPGTLLGDLTFEEGITIASFNKLTVFNNKLYMVAGGDFGHGILLEASDPAGGNNNFRRVSPPGMTLTYMVPFNGSLYIGQGAQPVDSNPPYKIVKMNTTTEPYTFTTVIDGTRLPAWLTAGGPKSVATMHVANGSLWIATNQPVELIRLNANDTWDLFMGNSRQLADGTQKTPLTGLGDGFDWWFNIHIHRMQDHGGFLYMASNDLANAYPLNTLPEMNALFGPRYGFDLNRTTTGWYINPITMNGFQENDPSDPLTAFNFTGRVMASTPNGLFIGTGNNFDGLQIWRGLGALPSVLPPATLETEKTFSGTVLSWAPVAGATSYHVFKSQFQYGFQLGVPYYAGGTIYPKPFEEIATTADTNYTDTTPLGVFSQYYVVADNGAVRSDPSNLGRSPSLAPVVTFTSLTAAVNQWAANGELAATLQATAVQNLATIKQAVIAKQYATALAGLAQIKTTVAPAPATMIAPWRKVDAATMIDKLSRRIDLASKGKIPALNVWF